jgi:hypothetical protein
LRAHARARVQIRACSPAYSPIRRLLAHALGCMQANHPAYTGYDFGHRSLNAAYCCTELQLVEQPMYVHICVLLGSSVGPTGSGSVAEVTLSLTISLIEHWYVRCRQEGQRAIT